MGTPAWVYSKYGVHKQVTYYDGYSGWNFPDVTSVGYQTALKKFLTAYAERYSSNPHIDFVSLRGYGAWGEWHDGHKFSSDTERIAALREIISIWVNAWSGSGKILSLPIAYDCQGLSDSQCYDTKQEGYEYFKKRSAYDYALSLASVTFNKDCVGFCTQPNEYRLIDEAYYSSTLPLIGEFGGFYRDFKNGNGGRSLSAGVDDAVRHRLNYITAFGWSCDLGDADIFYKEQKPLILNTLNRIGYRIFLNQVTLPESISAGMNFTLSHLWYNHAAGHFYGKYSLKLSLESSEGVRVWEGIDESFDLANSLANSTSAELRSDFQLPNTLSPGTYRVKISLVDPQSGLPKVNLAITGRDSTGQYDLGNLVITKP
jgi:hypothetical protein